MPADSLEKRLKLIGSQAAGLRMKFVSPQEAWAGLLEFPDGSIARLLDGSRPRPVRFLTFLGLFSLNWLPARCTDAHLRQTFIPLGTVVLAYVLRDPFGNSLGLGVVHMSCPEEVEKIFSAQQKFELAGAPVDIWEPPDPDNT